MSQWFRMYAEVLDDPKVQRLPAEDFKCWVNLLCLTAKHDGVLPPMSDIAFALRLDEKKAKRAIDKLISAGLITADEAGMKPHKWDARQYKSDVSTDRVKRFRKRSKERDGTGNETAPETEAETEAETETETETETEEANASPQAGAREADFSMVAFTADLCRDAGVPLPDHGTAERNRQTVETWTQAGADLSLIRETVTGRSANLRTSPRSLAFFDKPVRAAMDARKADASKVSEHTGALIDQILGRSAA